MKNDNIKEQLNCGNIYFDEKSTAKIDNIIQSQFKNLNGLVVVHKDNIVFERYYNGYTADDSFHVASVTKSIISALTGIAVDKKLINSIDEKVVSFFPQYDFPYDSKEYSVRNKVTIRNLLTMTAPYSFEDFKEPLDKLTMSKDWVKYSLDSMGTNGKIGHFKYSTCGAHILSAILTIATHKSAREFANEYLFAPLEMNTIPYNKIDEFNFDTLFGKKLKGWAYDHNGNSTGGWGLTLTTRDMARFGQLYLHDGVWNNKRILSKSWIDQSLTMHEGNYDLLNMKYGYMWWLENDDNMFAYAAIGDGGNIIYVVPQKELVVAISSALVPEVIDRRQFIHEYILPAINI